MISYQEHVREATLEAQSRFRTDQVSPSKLAQFWEVETGRQSHTFTFTSSTGTTGELPEILLEPSSTFVAVGASLGLRFVPTNKHLSQVHTQFHANPAVFGSNFDQYRALWNGSISAQVENKDIFPTLDTRRFLVIPDTQQQAAVADEVNNTDSAYQNHGVQLLPLRFDLVGRKKRAFRLDMGRQFDNLPSGGTLYVEMLLDGVLVSNINQLT